MRSRRQDDGSLELLLDTITNTFGGVLFLAILVALLLRTTSPQNGRVAETGEPLTAVEVARLEGRIKVLEATIEATRRRVALSGPASATADPVPLVELADLVARLQSALSERAESLTQTAFLQQEAEVARTRLDKIEAEFASAAEDLASAEARCDAAREEAAELSRAALQLDRPPGAAVIEQTVGLPRIHSTTKTEVALYVRFGRLFMMHRWERGQRSGPNTDQFVVVSGSLQVARPKPTSGYPIEVAAIDKQVVSLLGQFSPQRHYMTCVVFEDSFDVFQVLKAALVRQGFEYRLIPRRPGEPVYDHGGSGEAQ